LRAGFLVAVRLQDPRLRLDHLAERPVAHALPVWQRASLPPVRQHAAVLDRLEELADEAALADPRDADEGQELRGALLAHACESADDLLDLALAADERRPRLRREIDPEARMRLHGLPHPNRRLLPLGVDRLVLAVVDRLRGRAIGRLAGEDAVHRRGRLQPRRGVDAVARRHTLSCLWLPLEVDQSLARVHRDPDLELPLLGDPIADRQRGTHRPLRIVLPCNRSTEQRHHGVADELLHRSAPALELVAKPLVVRAQDAGDVLGVELLRRRRETDEIGEEDGDDLALARAHVLTASSSSASRMYRVAPTPR